MNVRRIVDAVQDDSFMVVLHNCGNTGHCTDATCRHTCPLTTSRPSTALSTLSTPASPLSAFP